MIGKIVSIAVASDAENGETVYALDQSGQVWERVYTGEPKMYARNEGVKYPPTATLTDTHVFYAGFTPGWRLVGNEESRPVYHPEDPRYGVCEG